jgi:hypothetical protein
MTNNTQEINIQVGQTIIMNDGSKFIVTAVKPTPKNTELNITLKPVSKIQNRYNTTWSKLKKLLQINMITIM